MEKVQAGPAPRITLEQWRCLAAVVEAGGYAQAAERLHKSQSSVTYSVQKLEELLGVEAFVIQGRKAVLTPAGEMLYRRARQLLDDAEALEHAARRASAGWESEIALAVEIVFPTWLLLDCLAAFTRESPQTRIELYETVMNGALDLLRSGSVDLAIAPHVPPGVEAEPLSSYRAIPAAHPDHPLHRLGRPLTVRDLRKHTHFVVRDSGLRRDRNALTVNVERRWTVSNMTTSIGAACRGYGFAWFPEDKIRAELAQGLLKPLPLAGGQERRGYIYLIFRDRDAAGPGTQRLAQILREQAAEACRRLEKDEEKNQASETRPVARRPRRARGKGAQVR